MAADGSSRSCATSAHTRLRRTAPDNPPTAAVTSARITAEAGSALYLAKLFGPNDTKAVVRLITALPVLVLDPLAVLLTLAAARPCVSECVQSRRTLIAV